MWPFNEDLVRFDFETADDGILEGAMVANGVMETLQ